MKADISQFPMSPEESASVALLPTLTESVGSQSTPRDVSVNTYTDEKSEDCSKTETSSVLTCE